MMGLNGLGADDYLITSLYIKKKMYNNYNHLYIVFMTYSMKDFLNRFSVWLFII